MKLAIILAAVLGLIVFGTTSSYAQTTSPTGSDPIYMKIAGIDGDVTVVGHEKEIELHSFQFSITNHVTLSSGGGSGAGMAQFSEIVVTKNMDKSSPLILLKTADGSHITQVDIFFVKTTSSGSQTYLHYILQDVIISGYSVSSGGDNPTESISLNFAKIQFAFIPTNPDGTAGSPIQVGWDLIANAKL
jgi:type VI secretion system secreted protein Hcp